MGYADTHFLIKDSSSCLGAMLTLCLAFALIVFVVIGFIIYTSFRMGRMTHLYSRKWRGVLAP